MLKTIFQNKILYPEILWERPVHYYKTQTGKIMVIAGSRGMTGIALLTSEAVFRSGTGILTLAFPEELKSKFTAVLPAAMTLALPQTHSGTLARKSLNIILEQINSVDIVIIGPGLSTNTETVQLIWELIRAIEKPIVIDADAIKALAYGIEIIKKSGGPKTIKEYFDSLKSKIIITPRIGEAAKIADAIGLGKEISKPAYIEKHKVDVARVIHDYLSGIVVLKGHETAISDGTKTVIDKIGGPEHVPGSSGDVLSGIIGSFVAQNPSKDFEAVCTAVYLNSMAGWLAKNALGERPVTASDIIRFLPEAIKISEN